HDDLPAIGLKVINPVGDRQAPALGTEIMVLDPDRLPTPESTVVLELTHQFLLLGVDADNRIAAAAELVALMSQVAELLFPLRPARGAKTLAVGVQCIMHFAQQPTDRVGANPQAQLSQLPTNRAQSFACPQAPTSARIPGRVLPQQGAQAVQDFGRFFSTATRPPPRRLTRPRTTSARSNSLRPRACHRSFQNHPPRVESKSLTLVGGYVGCFEL